MAEVIYEPTIEDLAASLRLVCKLAEQLNRYRWWRRRELNLVTCFCNPFQPLVLRNHWHFLRTRCDAI